MHELHTLFTVTKPKDRKKHASIHRYERWCDLVERKGTQITLEASIFVSVQTHRVNKIVSGKDRMTSY
jgi:hypothetical protein